LNIYNVSALVCQNNFNYNVTSLIGRGEGGGGGVVMAILRRVKAILRRVHSKHPCLAPDPAITPALLEFFKHGFINFNN
jgi:hypothetical protein